MPADNGSRCHLDERFLPSSPALSQYDPEQLVCRSESPARALGVKSEQLLTQGKIFEDDILAGPECTNNPAEEVPEPYDHAQNLTGTLSIELGAKSLILRVYDVLMNDNHQPRGKGKLPTITKPSCSTAKAVDRPGCEGDEVKPRVVHAGARVRWCCPYLAGSERC